MHMVAVCLTCWLHAHLLSHKRTCLLASRRLWCQACVWLLSELLSGSTLLSRPCLPDRPVCLILAHRTCWSSAIHLVSIGGDCFLARLTVWSLCVSLTLQYSISSLMVVECHWAFLPLHWSIECTLKLSTATFSFVCSTPAPFNKVLLLRFPLSFEAWASTQEFLLTHFACQLQHVKHSQPLTLALCISNMPKRSTSFEHHAHGYEFALGTKGLRFLRLYPPNEGSLAGCEPPLRFEPRTNRLRGWLVDFP